MTGAIALDPESRAAEFHLGHNRALRVQVSEPDTFGICRLILSAPGAKQEMSLTMGQDGRVLLSIVDAWQLERDVPLSLDSTDPKLKELRQLAEQAHPYREGTSYFSSNDTRDRFIDLAVPFFWAIKGEEEKP